MRKYILACMGMLLVNVSFSQDITVNELLEKVINYHDPHNNWNTFNGELNIVMTTPKNIDRHSKVSINLPQEHFNLITEQDSIKTTYTITKNHCIISQKDSLRIANQKEKPKRSHCDMAELFKNYYTYLYGLPMKLKDPGTIIDTAVETKTFKAKTYLVLKAWYEESVGSDVWYFYFDPTTYAMEVYQFFRTDNKGQIKPDSGEYILLSETVLLNGIKMPKVRAWYYNKDDQYLGTDVLNP
ncbi:DUF6503 family protein [Cognatitamlana onchidii]|uniref:DUF6503 family protein n=1 Tax=Cognatitamlana onchidii TaxID=2562860 RepID=UPI0010A648BE|nr:DUF6503 family protein [Algibacter onchidii]